MSYDIAKKLWLSSLETETKKLDYKHTNIIKNAKKNKFDEVLKNYRNWSDQSDSGIPLQINKYNFKSYGKRKYIKFIISKIKTFLKYNCDEVDYFFDDLEVIKLMDGFDILKKCPVHLTPGNNLAYFLSKDISANVRWLRYIYFVSVIRNSFKNHKPLKLCLDIGSYYGGFQYVMKKIFKDSVHILVDFPHQLSRASLFLSESFPKSKIIAIYSKESFNKFFKEEINNKFDFLLLSADFYDEFSKLFSNLEKKIDLVTNFYSLGEMSRVSFNSYMQSELIRKAKNIYFCNRYDSSPFYEKTFDESYSILDYIIKENNIVLNRSSGIHNYMMPIRKLNGKTKARPISCGYFELIQTKI